jgi:hypothetical protein
MERVVGIVDELDAMAERMRQAASSLKLGEAQVMVRMARRCVPQSRTDNE